MRIEYIREFRELAKKLNFQETSRLLHITQPALSNHIKSLENELGVMLLDRSKGALPQLTKDGKVFLNGSSVLLAQYDSLIEECRRSAAASKRKLQISLPFLIEEAAKFLVNEAKVFASLHADVEVIVSSGSFKQNTFDGVKSGSIDCCIISSSEDNYEAEEIEIIPLHTEEAVLWLDVNNPLAFLEKVSAKDLEGYYIVLAANEKSQFARKWINGFLEVAHAPTKVDYYAESFDDFILNGFALQDIAIFPLSYMSYPTFQIRSDRMIRSFNPPLYSNVCVMFRKEDSNEAAVAFKKQIILTKELLADTKAI